jgi:hypothetical protein
MNNRLHFHWNRLIEDINPARQAAQHFLDMQTSRFDALAGDAARRRSRSDVLRMPTIQLNMPI